MRKSILWLLLITSITAQAQSIKGKVCLENDKSPVQFASVGLVQLPDSNIITGVLTVTDGGYLFEKVKPGTYFMKARYLGYKANGKQVKVEAGLGEIIVDTIYLTETTTSLSDVIVVSERIKGKEMVDRTVYAIPEVIAKTSNNGYDILKKIPQVNVDFQNNVTLNGSSNFIIQVDGRQRDKEFLAKLLPSDIESIEVISNPSGKYEGNINGVINIMLKREARYGMNGNAGINIKPFNKPTTSATGSLDYTFGKITFYVTGFFVSQKLDINTVNESHFATIDSTSRMAGNGGIKVTQSTFNGGFDYYLNDKNNLSFNIGYKPTGQKVGIAGETFLYKNIDPLIMISSLTKTYLQSDETSASLFYKRAFKKAVQEFTAETNYYHFKSTDGNDFTNTRHMYNTDSTLSTFSRLEENLNERVYSSAKFNYVHPIGMSAKVEAGYQLYFQTLNYVFFVDNLQSIVPFEYTEMRNSVYGGITYNLKKIGIQAMLRIENSHINADSVTSPDYSCFLPSFNIQYKFLASHNLKFTYNRRINRPGIYDMNPNYRIGQNYDITQGNPDLKPDYRDRLQLTYTWNFGSNYFSPYIYQEYFSNRISRQFLVINSPFNNALTTISKPFNLLNGYELGGGLNAMLWFININARIYKGHYNKYTGQSIFIPAMDFFSYSLTSYAFAQLDKKKTATAYLFLSYNGVDINAQTKTYSLPIYGIGVQKQLKNHSFGLFYLLPFSTYLKYSRTETQTPEYNSSKTTGINFSNYIQFMYSYKFNKGMNIKKLDRKIEQDSDSKSQVIGR